MPTTPPSVYAFLKTFDVALMPFARNKFTQFINQTKMLEYIAAHKPLVAAALLHAPTESSSGYDSW